MNIREETNPNTPMDSMQHVSYGVKNDMYASVATALLMTLDKGLGEEYTPRTKEAWTWVLGVISSVCM